MGGRFHLLDPEQIYLLLTVAFIHNEEKWEHERITARFSPADRAVPDWSAGWLGMWMKVAVWNRKENKYSLCLTGTVTQILMKFSLLSLNICYN